MSISSLTLRSVTENDEPFLLVLFASVRTREFSHLQADDQTKIELIRVQHQIRSNQYGVQYPRADHSIVMRDGLPIGRMLVDRNAEEIHLVDISLLQDHRGLGIGTQLLQELINESVAANAPLTLFVEDGNPAKRLYARLGFAEVGYQPPYVSMTRIP